MLAYFPDIPLSRSFINENLKEKKKRFAGIGIKPLSLEHVEVSFSVVKAESL